MITGRCYCGACRIKSVALPQAISYCHCSDCRRLTGAPIAAFAAFAPDDLTFAPALGAGMSHSPGVVRWFCTSCGSPLAATFEYLPGQVYIPVGLLDQAADLAPGQHAHYASRLPWLHIDDGLPRDAGSARDFLNKASDRG